MKGCMYCIHCVHGLRGYNDFSTVCTLTPSNSTSGNGYMKIDWIDYDRERMWFCPLKEPEVTNKI